MSSLAPIIDNDRRTIVFKALKLVRAANEVNSNPFPVVNEDDPHGRLQGSFLGIEAKNILIAAMVTPGVWDKLLEECPKVLPNPSEETASYQISSWKFWPTESAGDGLVGSAADLQANTLANLAFLRLVFEQQPALAGVRVKTTGARGKAARKAAAAAAVETPTTTTATDNAAVEDTIMTDAADDSLQTGLDDSVQSIGGTTATSIAAGTDIEVDTSDPTSLPNPNRVNRAFRLTKDWEYWPSIGVVGQDVSNVSHAQYGLCSDVLFESMKVKGMVDASAVKKQKAKAQPEEENAELAALLMHEPSMDILIDMLNQFMNDASGVLVYRKNSSKAVPEFEKFRNYLKTQDPIAYEGPQGDATTIQDTLDSLEEDVGPKLYIELGKKKREIDGTNKKTKKPTTTTPASATGGENDTPTGAGDGAPVVIGTKRKRGRPAGSKTTKVKTTKAPSGKGNKSARFAVDDDEEEEEEEDEGGDDEEYQQPKKRRGTAKDAEEEDGEEE